MADVQNILVGTSLLYMSEEETFWLLCVICEDIVPDYYSKVQPLHHDFRPTYRGCNWWDRLLISKSLKSLCKTNSLTSPHIWKMHILFLHPCSSRKDWSPSWDVDVALVYVLLYWICAVASTLLLRIINQIHDRRHFEYSISSLTVESISSSKFYFLSVSSNLESRLGWLSSAWIGVKSWSWRKVNK